MGYNHIFSIFQARYGGLRKEKCTVNLSLQKCTKHIYFWWVHSHTTLALQLLVLKIFILVFLTVPCRWKTGSSRQTKYKLSVSSSNNLGINSLHMAAVLTVLPSVSTCNNFNLKGLKQSLSCCYFWHLEFIAFLDE